MDTKKNIFLAELDNWNQLMANDVCHWEPNEATVKVPPIKKRQTATCMRKGRHPNANRMPYRQRLCAFNSRFLACSSGVWCVVELGVCIHSQCFKSSATTLMVKNIFRLKDNNCMAAGK